MNRDNFHIYHQSFLNPLLATINKEGLNIDKISKEASLNKFNYSDSDSYIPYSVICTFLEKVKIHEGVRSITNTFYTNYEINDLGDYGDLVMDSPDLLSLIIEGIKYNYLLQSNVKMSLDVKGAVSELKEVHFGKQYAGSLIAKKISFSMIIRAFKTVLGDNWLPLKVRTPENTRTYIEDLFQTSDFEIQLNADAFSFVFKTDELMASNSQRAYSVIDPANTISSFNDKVYALMKSSRAGYMPYLGDYSSFFNVSNKTIARALKEEGTTFSGLCKRHLFTKALELLSIHKLSIEEVSQQLGYSNSSNFQRSFKKWTGTSPNLYRVQKNLI